MNRAFKIFLFTLFVTIVAFSSVGATADYKTLESKAERFYRHHEWASALAMYQLMIDQRPAEIPVYAQAVVASGMMNRPDLQLDLKHKTDKMGLPIDSLFLQVSKRAFAIYRPEIYEGFLILLKDKQPWLARVINIHLLDYYTFRNDPIKMIEIAEMLLKSTPDNVSYLQTMGDAYCLKGDLAEGMEWYKKILDYQPDNYRALLTLGNYYNIMLNKLLEEPASDTVATVLVGVESNTSPKAKLIAADALEYLVKAHDIKATPYVEKMIEHLNAIIAPPTTKKRR